MPTPFKNYYATLGVTRDADADEIKKAFRKLARLYHPDTAKDKKTAEEKFKEINEANEVLGDPEKRKKYDLLGSNWNDPGSFQSPPHGNTGSAASGGANEEFHFGGTGFSDFFEQYFSGGSRYGFPQGYDEGIPRSSASSGQKRRGHDIEGDILVTLEEAMHGTQRPVSLETINRQTGVAQKQSFEVRIPPGATDGRRIRIAGHGEPGINGGESGDLYLRVRHASHPEFTTLESDVFHEIDIAPWEAVLGTEIVVPTLDGSIKLKIPQASENGQKLRLKGRGLPRGKTGERGDFYVTLRIVLPTQISDEERTHWESLRSSSTFNPRA
jgi:curved DNA-binding protein